MLLLVALPLAGLYAVRAHRLARVAGAPEPFDLAAAGQVEIAPEKNAFRLYRMAWLALGPTELDGTRDPEKNRDALKLFLEGSKLSEALYNQPGAITITTRLDVIEGLRALGRLAAAEAGRLEEAGDPVEAWRWHRASLRASRHAASYGPIIQRLVAIAMHATASEGVTRWAADPANDAEALRGALRDTREAYALSQPLSEAFKVEYLYISTSLADPRIMGPGAATPVPVQKLSMIVAEEPTMSQAVLKRAFANYLSHCDQPRFQRPALVPGTGKFFSRSSEVPMPAGELSPEDLEQALQGAPLARLSLPPISASIEAHDREMAREALLELTLVLQLHHREHGAFPESAAELTGPDMKQIPIDPFGKGEPLRYRRELDPAEGATIWSIGPDGVDDGGRSDPDPSPSPPDIVIRVKPPTR